MAQVSNTLALKKHDRSVLRSFSNWLTYNVTKTAYAISPYQTAKWIRSNHFRPNFILTNNEQEQMRELSIETVVEVSANKKVRVFEWGYGPTILFVHGWAGRGLQFQKFIAPLVARGYRVVTFDHLGHGYSSKVPSSYLEFIKATQAVADYCGKIHTIVGHSMGASAVLKVAEGIQNPTRIVMIAPMDELDKIINEWEVKIPIFTPIFKKVFSQIEKETNLNLNEAKRHDYTKLNEHIGLLIHDKKDRINSIDRSYDIKLSWDRVTMLETEGLGHTRILKNDWVIQKVLDFIN